MEEGGCIRMETKELWKTAARVFAVIVAITLFANNYAIRRFTNYWIQLGDKASCPSITSGISL
jgi:hypothetical protein